MSRYDMRTKGLADFNDMKHWMEFVAGLTFSAWQDEDWIPTFDIMLVHRMFPRIKFKGTMTMTPRRT